MGQAAGLSICGEYGRSTNKETLSFYKSDESGFKEVLDGIRLKTLVYGEKTLFSEFRLAKGRDLPRHSQPHGQTGYLVSGRIRLTIGDETFEVTPGDS